jgi:phenylalanyl-tRNA synthetase beta chain
MKVTYNWLKDFVQIKLAAPALAEKLTMAGLEVTSLEEKDGDFVFEIEITANRPDLLSVIGIAREVAAITKQKLRVTSYQLPVTKKNKLPFKINIENKKDCPLYTAKIIKGVGVGPSPDWLRGRLELIGCRSVNNVVDITNYILSEWGEPLHAFDLDKLSPEAIIVRRAKPGEKIITLDGAQRTLDADILLIADKGKPVAVAGIMGGLNTEVTQGTKNILLEAAIFNPIVIRRARQKLGLQSESSYRFERGVDLETAELASQQASRLIQEIAAGECVLAKSAGSTKISEKSINLEVPFVAKILGVNLAAPGIKQILNALGFTVKSQSKNNLLVTIPLHRQDINLEIDLIEEIARIYGYANIPQTSPRVSPSISADQTKEAIAGIKNILVGLGLNEAVTYSLIDANWLKYFKVETESLALEILNPLSQEQGILRPSLIPSLAACVAYNLNQKQDYINLFEIAKVFSSKNSQAKEELALGIALCGIKPLLIAEQGLVKEKAGLLHLKGICEILFGRLGLENYSFKNTDNPALIAIYIEQEKIGSLRMLEESALRCLDIKNKDVLVAELSLERLLSHASLLKRFQPLPRYPGIARDISFILKENTSADEIIEAIKNKGTPLIREAKIIDYYKGQQIPSGFKGLTISCFYRAAERTLTEAEINPLHASIASMLVGRFGAKIR